MHEGHFGVRIRNKETGYKYEKWFTSRIELDNFIKLYSDSVYEVEEYLHYQQEIKFD